MRVGPFGGIAVRSCSRLESECNFVERSPCLIAFRWPLCVARRDGGYLLSCLTVKDGNVVRYPAEIAFANVARVGEKREA